MRGFVILLGLTLFLVAASICPAATPPALTADYTCIVPHDALAVQVGGVTYKVEDLPCGCPYLKAASWEPCYDEYRQIIAPDKTAPIPPPTAPQSAVMLASYAMPVQVAVPAKAPEVPMLAPISADTPLWMQQRILGHPVRAGVIRVLGAPVRLLRRLFTR